MTESQGWIVIFLLFLALIFANPDKSYKLSEIIRLLKEFRYGSDPRK